MPEIVAFLAVREVMMETVAGLDPDDTWSDEDEDEEEVTNEQ